MGYRISVDTGGTFTDLALSDAERVIGIFKEPTTPDDMFRGILSALELAGHRVGLDVGGLLRETEEFVYATTRSTNAILEQELEPPAFLTTRGHRDILLYREGGKPEPFNLRIPYPEPFVPRWLTFEVSERVLADGSVRIPLDELEVRGIAKRLGEIGVHAVGVCLLWSVVNPQHEVRIGEILAEELPHVDVTLSHHLNPIIREYRRASSTVINAALKPLMHEHLQHIDRRLRDLGFLGEPLMVTHASGGMLSFEEMSEHPIHTIDSGPAMAPIAGLRYTQLETDFTDVIVVDAGGTSFDVSLIRDRAIGHTPAKWLGPEWLGHMTGMSAVDTRSIGAGGGSIAWVDSAGLLHVGPQSAGAVPGPVCYGQGGTRPTVTDCALVLGYINPGYFLGGRIGLDRQAALEAIERDVAEPLHLSPLEAAEGVLKVAGDSMTNLIREMTVNQGLDPRECLIVAGGGASALNIVWIARELECPEVLIPSYAAALSAVGGLYSDLVTEQSLGFFTDTSDFDRVAANQVLAKLAHGLDDFFKRVGGHGDEVREFCVDARYAYQAWELEVSLGDMSVLEGQGSVERLADAFHALHERTFAVRDEGQIVECVNWRARGWKVLSKPELPRPELNPRPPQERSAYIEGAHEAAAVYRAGTIGRDQVVRGPAIVEEPATTIVLPRGASLRVSPFGNYRIDVKTESPRDRGNTS